MLGLQVLHLLVFFLLLKLDVHGRDFARLTTFHFCDEAIMLTVQHGQLCEPQRRVEQAHCVEQHHKEHQSDHGPRDGVALGRTVDAHTAQVQDQDDAPVEANLAHNVLPVDYTGLPLVFRAHEGQQSQTHAEERHCHEEGRVVHEHDQGCVDHSAH